MGSFALMATIMLFISILGCVGLMFSVGYLIYKVAKSVDKW